MVLMRLPQIPPAIFPAGSGAICKTADGGPPGAARLPGTPTPAVMPAPPKLSAAYPSTCRNTRRKFPLAISSRSSRLMPSFSSQ